MRNFATLGCNFNWEIKKQEREEDEITYVLDKFGQGNRAVRLEKRRAGNQTFHFMF
jgi:hypothetical protein